MNRDAAGGRDAAAPGAAAPDGAPVQPAAPARKGCCGAAAPARHVAAAFDAMTFPLCRVAVLGVGMIGGSVAGALRERGLAHEVVGWSPSDDGPQAVALGLLDRCAPDVAAAVAGADLVVLAAPIPAMPALLEAIAPHLAADTVVTDCASTKQSVIAAARRALGAGAARFVAAHPIAGSERSGPGAAKAALFDGAQLMLCPEPDTDARALAIVAELWRRLGANLVRMGAAEHDRLYAELSHWPHAVAFALCAAVGQGGNGEQALRFAGAGLRDTTRIGASSPALWADILLDNRDASLACAQDFQREIDAIVAALQAGDREALAAAFARGSDWRKRLA